LLRRRNRATGVLAFYRCYSPQPVPLHILVHITGRRWTVDQHQIRRRSSRHHWTVMAMLAHALLALVTSAARMTGRRPSAGSF
jgi:hypothetical protein